MGRDILAEQKVELHLSIWRPRFSRCVEFLGGIVAFKWRGHLFPFITFQQQCNFAFPAPQNEWRTMWSWLYSTTGAVTVLYGGLEVLILNRTISTFFGEILSLRKGVGPVRTSLWVPIETIHNHSCWRTKCFPAFYIMGFSASSKIWTKDLTISFTTAAAAAEDIYVTNLVVGHSSRWILPSENLFCNIWSDPCLIRKPILRREKRRLNSWKESGRVSEDGCYSKMWNSCSLVALIQFFLQNRRVSSQISCHWTFDD